MMQLLENELRYLMVLHHIICMGGVLLGALTPAPLSICRQQQRSKVIGPKVSTF
jgi:hypothetical protein